MTLTQRIEALSKLGKALGSLTKNELLSWVDLAGNENLWFTQDAIEMALNGISKMLQKDKLELWVKSYLFTNTTKRVGIVMAGNIPMVGFHDLLSVVISNHTAVIKLSSQDKVLLPKVTDLLFTIEPKFKSQIAYVAKLETLDAVIATGSDNSARYFKQYFRKQPNIIRKNRTSCAVLTGNESDEELLALGKDIFSFFGLGCRNVSKLYVPKNYNFVHLLNLLEVYKEIGYHSKWVNNYDYNKSIYLVNREPHLDNGFLLLKESEQMVSPLTVLFYQEYTHLESLKTLLDSQEDKIQCIIGNEATKISPTSFGNAQYPEVWDYADGVDTLAFLSSL